MTSSRRSRLRVLLIKPSHYDDDGYVVQWWRNLMPTHSLNVVWGLMEDAAHRAVLGPDVGFEITAIDETATRVRPRRLVRAGPPCDKTLVMLVGVQTNQFPRALSLGRRFRDEGCMVAIGGFHVSGVVAMTPDWAPGGLQTARDAGITLYAGELEDGLDALLRDAWNDDLKPLYNALAAPPDLTRAPPPKLVPRRDRKTLDPIAGVDMGRGCPFRCTFCAIVNVAGNGVRARAPEVVEGYLRQCAAQGIRHYLVVDDNFARVPNWEAFLDVFIRVQKDTGMTFDLFLQVDTRAHKVPGFVEKAHRAGLRRVFLGLESVRQDNLASAGKRHNKVDDLYDMLMTWKRARVMIIGTLLVGLPNDTPETLAEDVALLQQHLPIDVLETTLLIPLPGSVDHQRLVEAGAELADDLNLYDTEHPVTPHPLMSAEEWRRTYNNVYKWYYTPRHIQTILERGLVHGLPMSDLLGMIVAFYAPRRFENVHPYLAGALRRRDRTDRRAGMPLEPPLTFYARHLWRLMQSQSRLLWFFLSLNGLLLRARWAVARGARRDRNP